MLAALLRLDVACLRAVYGGNGPEWLTFAMIAFTVSASGWENLVFVPLFALRRTRVAGAVLAVTLVSAGLFGSLLKHAFFRRRPAFVVPDVHALWHGPRSPSFPSGHAVSAFTIATFLSCWFVRNGGRGSRTVSLFLFAWAALVAVSRVYLGVHFPSDAAAGAFIGVVFGCAGSAVAGRAEARVTAPPLPPASSAPGS
jgi:undecaprenyl-diphosphatase